jgi:hypothetical protein
MKILEFYENVVKSFGLDYDENHYIIAGEEQAKIDGLPLVLPTKYHNKTAVKNNRAVKYIFNPLMENITTIRKDLEYLLKVLNINANMTVAMMFRDIVENLDKDSDTLSIDMVSLLNNLNKAKGKAKKLIDAESEKLFAKLLTSPNFLEFRLIRGMQQGDKKVKFGIKINSPLLEYISSGEADDDKDFKRRKDRDFVRLLLEELVGELIGKNIGSNHSRSPDVVAVLKLNLVLAEYFDILGEDLNINNPYPEILYDKELLDKELNKLISKAKLITDTEEFIVEDDLDDEYIEEDIPMSNKRRRRFKGDFEIEDEGKTSYEKEEETVTVEDDDDDIFDKPVPIEKLRGHRRPEPDPYLEDNRYPPVIEEPYLEEPYSPYSPYAGRATPAYPSRSSMYSSRSSYRDPYVARDPYPRDPYMRDPYSARQSYRPRAPYGARDPYGYPSRRGTEPYAPRGPIITEDDRPF